MEASPTQTGQEPTHVLVVSNETVGGHRLLEAIEQRAARGPIRCTVVSPGTRPTRDSSSTTTRRARRLACASS